MPKFTCPVDGEALASLEDGVLTVNGDVTMCGGMSLKCTKHDVFLVGAGAGVTATLGGMDLLPGDWLAIDGAVYKHHTLYVGNGEFVSYQTSGVLLEGSSEYQGKRAHLVHRGGASAAAKARSRVGERAYNLLTNNCEQFCSACVGLGHHSKQVVVAAGKCSVVAGSALANHLNRNSNISYTCGLSGGFSTGGGFSGGLVFKF
jgi:hypothetical protein